MFNIFKKNQPTDSETVTFKVNGMHCTSCSLNIDGELEDTNGVLSAKTSYAKGETTISYLPEKTNPNQLRKVLEKLKYQVS